MLNLVSDELNSFECINSTAYEVIRDTDKKRNKLKKSHNMFRPSLRQSMLNII